MLKWKELLNADVNLQKEDLIVCTLGGQVQPSRERFHLSTDRDPKFSKHCGWEGLS